MLRDELVSNQNDKDTGLKAKENHKDMGLKTKEEVIRRYNSFDENKKPNAVYCRILWDGDADGDTMDDFIALFPTLGEDCDDEVVYSCHGGMSEFLGLMDENNGSDFRVTEVLGFCIIG